MAGVIDFYAKFVNYRDVIKSVKKLDSRMVLSLRTAMNQSLNLIGQTAVSRYMVEATVTYQGKGKPKIERKQREKLNIVSGRLARSILGLYSFAQGATGENEAIREIEQKGSKIIGVIGSRVPYAAIHEFGGTINHTNLFGRGIKATIHIPARPYLRPAGRDSEPKIKQIFDKYISEALND